jgi:hypothetical protein
MSLLSNLVHVKHVMDEILLRNQIIFNDDDRTDILISAFQNAEDPISEVNYQMVWNEIETDRTNIENIRGKLAEIRASIDHLIAQNENAEVDQTKLAAVLNKNHERRTLKGLSRQVAVDYIEKYPEAAEGLGAIYINALEEGGGGKRIRRRGKKTKRKNRRKTLTL